MWEWLVTQIKTNQFLSGAIGGSLSFAVLNYCKSWFVYIGSILKDWFIRDITVMSHDNAEIYNSTLEFVTQYIKHPKNIRITMDNKISPSVGYGTHWFWYNWYTFIRISINIDTNNQTSLKTETIVVYFLGFSPRKTRLKFIDELKTFYQQGRGQNHVCQISQWGNFEIIAKRKDRPTNTLFLTPENKKDFEGMIEQIKTVMSGDNIQTKLGLTRKIGILIYGQPGCGKSTMIQCIATIFKMNIYYVDISKDNFEKLERLMQIPSGSILVFEDIDAAEVGKDRQHDDKNSNPKGNLGLVKLLRILDGIGLNDETIVIATTNYPERLDAALTRHGRFDVKFEIQPANQEVGIAMAEYFDPNMIDQISKLNYPIPQASIQNLLLKKQYETCN